jgi:hypothetical protein
MRFLISFILEGYMPKLWLERWRAIRLVEAQAISL